MIGVIIMAVVTSVVRIVFYVARALFFPLIRRRPSWTECSLSVSP